MLNMGSTAVIARLLSPQDFGLLAMVATVTSFIAQFKDLGLSMATVQKAEVNHQQISTLFWVNVALSTFLTLLTAALAPVVAWVYGEPRLTQITLVFACGFIFSGLTVQHQALLQRQMSFASLAAIDLTSMFLGVTSAIIAALQGAGYWALVLLQLVTTISHMVGVWLMCGWRPGLPVRNAGVRSMLAFGGNITGFNFLNYFVRTFDNVVIGYYSGAQQLGIYAKAYQLLLLPIQQINTPITSVAIPALSNLQADPDRYRDYYRKGILLLVTLGMPLIAFLFVSADKVILAILGKKWVDAILIFRILAPAAFVGTFNVATGWVYTSLGRADRQLRWSVFVSTVTAISFLIGIKWGAIGVAAAVSITICGLRYPGIVYCFKSSPLKVSDLTSVIWRPTLASTLAGVALFAVNRAISFGQNLGIGLAIDLCLYTAFYILVWSLLPNGWQTLRQILKLFKQLRRKPSEVENAS